MFLCNDHHHGRHVFVLTNVIYFKKSIKTHRCGQFGGVAAYVIRSAMDNIVPSTVTLVF